MIHIDNYLKCNWKYIHAQVFIYPVSLRLLVGAFDSFTFKVIINMYHPIIIFLIVLGLFFVGLFLVLFPAQSSSFSICCKAGLVVLNSLKFCLSGKLLISLSNQRRVSLGRVHGCRFFPFIALNMSCHSLLVCRVSVEKSADSLMGVLSYVICHFHLLFSILKTKIKY